MNFLRNLKSDIPASIIVFFVALPLCLGIALASGASPFAGLVSGIVGGIVVGSISRSAIGVSGPAAGLAAVVLVATTSLGGYSNFLVAVVLAGSIQIVLGLLKAGIIGYYFPSSVIKGMLAGIGVIIILKQIPYFFGYDSNSDSDWFLTDMSGNSSIGDVVNALNNISPGATIIAITGLAILLFWDYYLVKKSVVFRLIPGPLIAVFVGIIYQLIVAGHPLLGIKMGNLVSVPVPDSVGSFLSQFQFPTFSAITNPQVWIVAFTIALIASLETLLSVEASDKIDPKKRVTPTNRELIAQGIGNMVSGLIGGLPVTQVVVRSSANVQSGAKSKMSTILHGFILLLAILFIPRFLNLLPLSVLSSILFVVGYKLARPKLFINTYKAGWQQFLPFILTLGFIVFKDLLWGISVGMVVGIFIVLYKSYKNSHFVHREENGNSKRLKITLAEELSFFNKGAILKELEAVPANSYLQIDSLNNKYIDPDIVEILDNYGKQAKGKNIQIQLISPQGKVENPESFYPYFRLQSA